MKKLKQLDGVYEDQDTLRMIRDYERGKLVPVKNQTEFKNMLRRAAARYLKENNLDDEGQKKDARINIRVSTAVVDKIKRIAADEGLPYQTYIASALYKIANGRMKDTGAGKR